VNNNPLRYVDPSGHCSGDPSDRNNPDIACWDEWFEIQALFKNIHLGDANWGLGELNSLHLALLMILNAFGGDMSAFMSALGNVSIYRSTANEAAGIAPPGYSTVMLFPGMFFYGNGPAKDLFNSTFGIIHELGHIWDTKGVGAEPEAYRSQSFINILNGGKCDPGYLGCLSGGGDIVYVVLNLISNLFEGDLSGGWGYDPKGSTSDKRSSMDDFADSFAQVVFDVNGLPPVKTGAERIDPVREWIIKYWLSVK
jgi:hypothetical protein